MPVAPARPCAQAGCPALIRGKGSRCAQHARQFNQQRGAPNTRGYGPDYRKARAATIKAQPWCGRCFHTGSKANPLTANHLTPLKRGGTLDDGLETLCRSCNSKLGAK